MNFLNKLVVATLPAVPKPITRYFASRYIAGEHLRDAVAVVRELNAQGMMATIDVLGEDIRHRPEALAARDAVIQVLEAIRTEKLDSNVSIKLTQLGLKLDVNFCLEGARMIVQRAAEYGNFVRIDMEDSSCTDDTLWIYRQLRKEYSNVGIVLQAYLRRTEQDARALIAEGLGHFRLCKGIYIEPESIAYKRPEEINNNFMRVLELMLTNGAYVGIATHDDELIERSYMLIEKLKLPRDAYEFQVLLGVREDLRSRIVHDRHRMRVYVPFGRYWYEYSLRRFKENPRIAGQVFRSLFRRDAR